MTDNFDTELFLPDRPEGEWAEDSGNYYMPIGALTLELTKSHPDHKGSWFARCVPFFSEVVGDPTMSAKVAQAAAVGMLSGELHRYANMAHKAMERTIRGGERP